MNTRGKKSKTANMAEQKTYKDFMGFNCEVSLWNVNITDFQAECVVNCTGPNFEHAAGVSRAINKAAGPKLSEESQKYLNSHKYLNYETVVVTDAFKFKNYKHILHVVSPYDGLNAHHTILKNTIVNILRTAFETIKLKSVAMPFIGTGNNGIDIDDFLYEFCNAVQEYFKSHSLKIKDNLQIHLITNSDSLDVLSGIFDSIIGKTGNGVKDDKKRTKDGESESDDDDDKQDQAAAKKEKTDDDKKDDKKEKKDDDNCVICMDKINNEKKLDKCGHTFCKDCIEQYFKSVKETCPVCGVVYGITKGTQPPGTMNISKIRRPLPGYEKCGSIEIYYNIPSGIQGPEHPHPNRPYYGTTRLAYLPDNKEGNEVLQLLKLAFDNRLIFTVGQSRTTNADDVVTWNDIHHKTSPIGGPTCFGYPDPTYLNRVKQELAAKGIVLPEK